MHQFSLACTILVRSQDFTLHKALNLGYVHVLTSKRSAIINACKKTGGGGGGGGGGGFSPPSPPLSTSYIPYSMGTPTPRAYSGDPLFYGDSSARPHSYATGKHVIRRGGPPKNDSMIASDIET